ncbi:hypothetical protein N7486_006149 [Penicillium sp. IBT 16267x]|nr:hypothetical protein N7486_006149 [Penicillium sp. IBT 16267x]
MPDIHDRIREEVSDKELALWTALTSADPASELIKLSNPEANFMFPKTEVLTLEDHDKFRKALKAPFHRFDSYRIDEVRIFIIDLMAATVTCKVHAERDDEKYRATSHTTWSQASDGEWRIVTHQECRV